MTDNCAVNPFMNELDRRIRALTLRDMLDTGEEDARTRENFRRADRVKVQEEADLVSLVSSNRAIFSAHRKWIVGMERLCQLCGKPASQFAKAHPGIGRAFFHDFRRGEPNSVFFNVTGGGKLARRIQAGIWDGGILCLDCEAKFSRLDAYGWQILGKPDVSQPYFDDDFHVVGFRIECDTDKLRRFILSSLWRASVSKIDGFRQLYLGIHERPIIERLFDKSPLRPDEYPTSVILLEKDYLGKNVRIIFPPLTDRLESGLMCSLYLSPRLKIITTMGDSSCLLQAEPFLIAKPDRFLMLSIPMDWPHAEAGYVNYIRQSIQRLRKVNKR